MSKSLIPLMTDKEDKITTLDKVVVSLTPVGRPLLVEHMIGISERQLEEEIKKYAGSKLLEQVDAYLLGGSMPYQNILSQNNVSVQSVQLYKINN